MASIRITFTNEEKYLVDYLRSKSKPNLFIKDLIKEAMNSEYYRLTGQVPAFFGKISDKSIANSDLIIEKNDNISENLTFIDEDDIGVDISDMEDF